jgi:hypothetical protein
MPTGVFGKLAVDYEQRVDYDRLHKERQQRGSCQVRRMGWVLFLPKKASSYQY